MKRIVLILLALVLAIASTACGKKNKESGESGGGSPSGTGEVRRGSITIAIPMSLEEKYVLEAVTKEYTKLNPFVTITLDSSGSSGTYTDWLNSVLANSKMSDVGADIVRNNLSSHYFGSNKFVDFSSISARPIHILQTGEDGWTNSIRWR